MLNCGIILLFCLPHLSPFQPLFPFQPFFLPHLQYKCPPTFENIASVKASTQQMPNRELDMLSVVVPVGSGVTPVGVWGLPQ